jgi:hypothetical protein
MKNITLLACCLLASAMLWGQSSPNCSTASDDDFTTGEIFFNFGSVSNAYSGQQRTNFTIGQPTVGANQGQQHVGGLGFWARLLAPPAAPVVLASEAISMTTLPSIGHPIH